MERAVSRAALTHSHHAQAHKPSWGVARHTHPNSHTRTHERTHTHLHVAVGAGAVEEPLQCGGLVHGVDAEQRIVDGLGRSMSITTVSKRIVGAQFELSRRYCDSEPVTRTPYAKTS